jgi:hypothetical protein
MPEPDDGVADDAFAACGHPYLFFDVDLREVFRDGTFAPFSRASLSPIAIACLRLVTFLPELLLSVPFFFRRIADSTLFDAALPYFAMRASSCRALQAACSGKMM